MVLDGSQFLKKKNASGAEILATIEKLLQSEYRTII